MTLHLESPRRVRLSLLLSLLLPLACDARAEPPAPAPAPRQAPAPRPAPAPAPPPAPAPSPYLRAADMEYLERIHVPPGTPADRRPGPDAELPMLIALHGLGDRPEQFEHLLDDLPVAARIIVPRGLDPVDDGFSWFPLRARSSDVAGLSRGIAAAAERIAALVRELQRTRPTRGLPVVTGFSQGGMLSFTLAVYHPTIVGVAVPVGGWLPPPLWPSALPGGRLPKIVALHGEADPTVKFAPTLEAVEHLEKLGWPVALKRYPEVGHGIPPNVRKELYRQLQAALEPAP